MEWAEIIALILGYAAEVVIVIIGIVLLVCALMWGWEETKETRLYKRMKGRKK